MMIQSAASDIIIMLVFGWNGAKTFPATLEDAGGGEDREGKKKKRDVCWSEVKRCFGTAKRKGGSGRQPIPGRLRLLTGWTA